MQTHRIINWSLAALVAMVLSSAWLLDAPLERNTEQGAGLALLDALHREAAQARFDKAAAQICGPNAGWIEQSDGAIRCTLKNGKPTVRVALVQP